MMELSSDSPSSRHLFFHSAHRLKYHFELIARERINPTNLFVVKVQGGKISSKTMKTAISGFIRYRAFI